MATIEIGKAGGATRTFDTEIDTVSFSVDKDLGARGNRASISLELPITQALPELPALVLIKGRDVNGEYRKFAGELFDEGVNVDFSDSTRKYDLQVEDFFSYTGREQIDSYRVKKPLTLILPELLTLGGAFVSGKPLNLLNHVIIANSSGGSSDPGIANVDFGWDDGPKYLFEALDLLSGIGYSWEVIDSPWDSIANLKIGAIAAIQFRRNDVQASAAPKPVMRIPRETDKCPDIFWESNPSLRVIGPRATRVIILGKNGNPDPSTPTSVVETIKYTIPAASVQLSYEYPESATEITLVELIP